MSYEFNSQDIREISNVLAAEPELEASNTYIWKINNPGNKQSLILTLNNNVNLSEVQTGSLISVQTLYGYYELHDAVGYVVFEPDEIIFVQSGDVNVSCLIIGKQCTCSMFANINREILNADFTQLDPVVLLSAMQLSITESILT